MICDFNISSIINNPFPHVIKQQFIQSEIYDELKPSYPDLPRSGGRTGYSLYRGDPGYDNFIQNHHEWKVLFNCLMSQEFINYVTQQFGNMFESNGCFIDPNRVRFKDFIEAREDMREHIHPPEHYLPEDLFVRIDIQQGKTGYSKGPHCDLLRRFATCLIYFNDADEIKMQGGELRLHQPGGEIYSKITPRNNLAVIFPRFPNSFHSGQLITYCKKPRNFLYIAISSTHNIWPA